MITIIAGSRGFADLPTMRTVLLHTVPWRITTVVSGGARGADQLGELWAGENGIPIVRFPALWDVYGKSAGYKRNVLMAENAEALVAFWDGVSRGTKHMIETANERRLTVFIHRSVE